MVAQLRLLLIEDSEDDATLLVREVKRGGYQVEYRRVEYDVEKAAAKAVKARTQTLYVVLRHDAHQALELRQVF